MKIVAVDDSESLREYVSTLLEGAGHTVYHAGNALDAIETIAVNPVDLVLSDVNMEEMDGFALARSLRGDPALADLPIVFVTGEDSEEFRAKSRLSGANGWLMKPFQPEQLLRLVRSFEF